MPYAVSLRATMKSWWIILWKPSPKDGFRMQTLITEIVTSYPFLYRRIQEPVTSVTSLSHEKKLSN